MRILFQSDGFLPDVIGGAEIFALRLLQALKGRGHEILVLTTRLYPEDAEHIVHEGIDIVRLPFQDVLLSRDLSTYVTTCARLNSIAEEFRPDLLFMNDVARSTFFFFRQRAVGHLPRLLVLHAPVRDAGRDALQNRVILEADLVVAVSRSLYADATSMALAADKLIHIENALPAWPRARISLPSGPPVVLCIGRLVVEKGFDVALRALADVRERRLEFQFVIAGNGNELSKLQALAGRLGIVDNVHFTGWVAPDAIADLIEKATIVLVPSRWREPFGLVALEAAQMGRPVIASDIGGLPEIVHHNETGLLVTADDHADLAQAVIQLLSQPDKARRMGLEAELRSGQMFNFDKLVDSYEAALLETLTRAGKNHLTEVGT